jgi:hypothetical protein
MFCPFFLRFTHIRFSFSLSLETAKTREQQNPFNISPLPAWLLAWLLLIIFIINACCVFQGRLE